MVAFNPGIRILIIDDSALVRQAIIKGLEELGFHKFEEAGNGEDALLLLRQSVKTKQPFELIFLDIAIPIINGLELLKIIRDEHAFQHIPIIMATADSRKALLCKAVELGATNYMVKPFTFKTIKSKLTKVLGKIQE